MSEEQKTQKESVENTQAPAAELTVQDLASLRQIIDVASQRGTFKPNEMIVVGTVYNKLDSFLSAVQAQQTAKDDAVKGE